MPNPALHTLRTDKEIFDNIEGRIKTLRSIRFLVLHPLQFFGGLSPLVFVLFWPYLEHSIFANFRYDKEWLLWHLGAIALSLCLALVFASVAKVVQSSEDSLDEALDALDAHDYNNVHLVRYATGSSLTIHSLRPVPERSLAHMDLRVTPAAPTAHKLWVSWRKGNRPIREHDLVVLDKIARSQDKVVWGVWP